MTSIRQQAQPHVRDQGVRSSTEEGLLSQLQEQYGAEYAQAIDRHIFADNPNSPTTFYFDQSGFEDLIYRNDRWISSHMLCLQGDTSSCLEEDFQLESTSIESLTEELRRITDDLIDLDAKITDTTANKPLKKLLRNGVLALLSGGLIGVGGAAWQVQSNAPSRAKLLRLARANEIFRETLLRLDINTAINSPKEGLVSIAERLQLESCGWTGLDMPEALSKEVRAQCLRIIPYIASLMRQYLTHRFVAPAALTASGIVLHQGYEWYSQTHESPSRSEESQPSNAPSNISLALLDESFENYPEQKRIATRTLGYITQQSSDLPKIQRVATHLLSEINEDNLDGVKTIYKDEFWPLYQDFLNREANETYALFVVSIQQAVGQLFDKFYEKALESVHLTYTMIDGDTRVAKELRDILSSLIGKINDGDLEQAREVYARQFLTFPENENITHGVTREVYYDLAPKLEDLFGEWGYNSIARSHPLTENIFSYGVPAVGGFFLGTSLFVAQGEVGMDVAERFGRAAKSYAGAEDIEHASEIAREHYIRDLLENSVFGENGSCANLDMKIYLEAMDKIASGIPEREAFPSRGINRPSTAPESETDDATEEVSAPERSLETSPYLGILPSAPLISPITFGAAQAFRLPKFEMGFEPATVTNSGAMALRQNPLDGFYFRQVQTPEAELPSIETTRGSSRLRSEVGAEASASTSRLGRFAPIARGAGGMALAAGALYAGYKGTEYLAEQGIITPRLQAGAFVAMSGAEAYWVYRSPGALTFAPSFMIGDQVWSASLSEPVAEGTKTISEFIGLDENQTQTAQAITDTVGRFGTGATTAVAVGVGAEATGLSSLSVIGTNAATGARYLKFNPIVAGVTAVGFGLLSEGIAKAQLDSYKEEFLRVNADNTDVIVTFEFACETFDRLMSSSPNHISNFTEASLTEIESLLDNVNFQSIANAGQMRDWFVRNYIDPYIARVTGDFSATEFTAGHISVAEDQKRTQIKRDFLPDLQSLRLKTLYPELESVLTPLTKFARIQQSLAYGEESDINWNDLYTLFQNPSLKRVLESRGDLIAKEYFDAITTRSFRQTVYFKGTVFENLPANKQRDFTIMRNYLQHPNSQTEALLSELGQDQRTSTEQFSSPSISEASDRTFTRLIQAPTTHTLEDLRDAIEEVSVRVIDHHTDRRGMRLYTESWDNVEFQSEVERREFVAKLYSSWLDQVEQNFQSTTSSWQNSLGTFTGLAGISTTEQATYRLEMDYMRLAIAEFSQSGTLENLRGSELSLNERARKLLRLFGEMSSIGFGDWEFGGPQSYESLSSD